MHGTILRITVTPPSALDDLQQWAQSPLTVQDAAALVQHGMRAFLGEPVQAPEWAARKSGDTPADFLSRAAEALAGSPGGALLVEHVGDGPELLAWCRGVAAQVVNPREAVKGFLEPAGRADGPLGALLEFAEKGGAIACVKGDDEAHLTGEEALALALRQVKGKAKQWCEWKRGSNGRHPFRYFSSNETPALPGGINTQNTDEATCRSTEKPADVARSIADDMINSLFWGGRDQVAAMRAAGGIDAYEVKIRQTVTQTIAGEQRKDPIPGIS